MQILLDYFFPITANSPTPPASTAFLKQVCLVVKPASMVTTGVFTTCTSMAQVNALTANTEAQQLFNAGMSKVIILPMNDLDISAAMVGHESDFFTVLISSDFVTADVDPTAASGNVTITSFANLVSGTPDVVTVCGQAFTAQSGAATLGDPTFQAATSNAATATSLIAQINAHTATKTKVVASSGGSGVVTITALSAGSAGNALTLAYTDNDTNVGATKSGTTLTGGDGLFLGTFKGVTGVSSTNDTWNATQAAITNRCAFHTKSGNGAKNMCSAFGALLSNAGDWQNQQYIAMPLADDVNDLGTANSLFDSKISFVLNDDQFSVRLALFACGGQAIVAPYIIRNLEVDTQSKALQYVSANQPEYTHTQAALLQNEMQKVIDGDGDTLVGYVQRGWLASGTIAVSLEEDNFVASADIDVPTPRAMWRIFGTLNQS